MSLSSVLVVVPSLDVHIYTSGDVMVAFEYVKIHKGTYNPRAEW